MEDSKMQDKIARLCRVSPLLNNAMSEVSRGVPYGEALEVAAVTLAERVMALESELLEIKTNTPKPSNLILPH